MSVESTVPGAHVPASPELPSNRISRQLDRGIVAIGRLSSWIWLIMLAVVLANVFSRFVLARGSIALEELSWHCFGATLMLTLAYAVVMDDHVRVDVLREKMSFRTQAWIECICIVMLALPILVLMIDRLSSYAWTAYIYQEDSQAPSGLPYRFVLKSLMPLGLLLVVIALVSRALRCTTLLIGLPRALPSEGPTHGH
ncbi:TRAP transporter small permease subunit [Allohahella sp. A8]|uniref:TRAP transporter small permease subunit n=1 Tax=Allohahella sp. A8 TaxID=3141461 RepID=UPI000C098F66|nr:C4-dicarboxylate ABC transporter permease [Hahellaceae bacterium]|tara:strand:- start:71070 stop:71663 length:594 start_codon:yes stop_codon:yes gene_type:complete